MFFPPIIVEMVVMKSGNAENGVESKMMMLYGVEMVMKKLDETTVWIFQFEVLLPIKSILLNWGILFHVNPLAPHLSDWLKFKSAASKIWTVVFSHNYGWEYPFHHRLTHFTMGN